MKLITLNIWGGHVYDALIKFINAWQQVEIFCLQEVYHLASHKISTENRLVRLNIFSELQTILMQHKAFFRPVVNTSYGIGLFVKNTVEVLDEGEIIIHSNPYYSGTGPTHS